MRSLHLKDFTNQEEFMGSPNLGAYLGLSPVDALHMPMPLNIVLVGFAADGNMNVNISLHDLNTWFEHLDHVLPHTRIDYSELSCQEDGQCSGLVHGTLQPTPMPSYVHLNFTCNVVLLRKRIVADAFERAIGAFSRPVDPAIETGTQQVDALMMEAFMEHFMRALQLENSYSLVVLNPMWHVDEPVYGYRTGMSAQELQLLAGQTQRLQNTLNNLHEREPELPYQNPSGTSGKKRKSWFHNNVVTPKFTQQDSLFDSENWVNTIDTWLRDMSTWRTKALNTAGPERGSAAVVQAIRLMNRPDSIVGNILRLDLLQEAHLAADVADKIHSRFHSSHPAEDCLVNTWIARSGRWAMVDLTAGGKDWGPALGGDGVVHYHSLPHVHELFGQLKNMKEDVRQGMMAPDSKELQLKEQLDRDKATRIPAVANRNYHAYMMRKNRERGAPGAPSPTTDEEYAIWRRQYQEALLQAELDLLEEYALKHCNQQADPPLICGTLRQEVVGLRAQLSKVHSSSGSGSSFDMARDHKWDIFGDESNWEQIDSDVSYELQRTHDLFLGELAGVLSRALRHVIAPPTASWMPREEPDREPQGPRHRAHTTAPPYAKQVHFHIHVITDDARMTLHHASNSLPPTTMVFDVASFRTALEELRLDAQSFTFEVSYLSLHDEPALSVAVAAATKTTLHEVPSSADYIEAEMERVFLDSRELAHALRNRFGDVGGGPSGGRKPAAAAQQQGHQKLALHVKSREVPVYILQIERDVAVLIDEHYNARALEDMVLVVANAARKDEHPTGMMCGGSLVARPLSPLKEALAATLMHLGGVLPPHIGYNPRSHAITHDWQWSVGAHPQSFTSVGVHYTQLQKDALARSYLLDALDTSVDALNAALAKLMRAKPSPQLYKHISDNPTLVRDVLKRFSDIVSVWRSMVALAYTLDYSTALEYLPAIEADIDALSILVSTITKLAEPARCSGHLVDHLSPLVPISYVGSAVLTILAMLYALWPQLTRSKAKAN